MVKAIRESAKGHPFRNNVNGSTSNIHGTKRYNQCRNFKFGYNYAIDHSDQCRNQQPRQNGNDHRKLITIHAHTGNQAGKTHSRTDGHFHLTADQHEGDSNSAQQRNRYGTQQINYIIHAEERMIHNPCYNADEKPRNKNTHFLAGNDFPEN